MTLKVLGTDYSWTVVGRQESMLADAGISLVTAEDPREDALIEQVSDADGLITGLARITDRVLRAASICKVVSRGGVGVDNIEVATATDLGTQLRMCPTTASARWPTTLWRCWPKAGPVRQVGQGRWLGLPHTDLGITRLSGMTLGIIGLGRIGRAVRSGRRPSGWKCSLQTRLCQPKMRPALGPLWLASRIYWRGPTTCQCTLRSLHERET